MDARTDQGSLQRRSALRAAAAAGLAVPLACAGSAAAGTGAAASAAPDRPVAAEPGEHVIAHVRNARTGEIDIFRGSAQVRLHDVALAALLTRAAR